MSQLMKKLPLIPTPAMIEAGAERMLRFQDGSTRDDWDLLQHAAARNDAERVWRAMWLEWKSGGAE